MFKSINELVNIEKLLGNYVLWISRVVYVNVFYVL